MYSVETEAPALDEVAALPPEALPAHAELMSLLEVAPWSGDPYNLQRPDANMRTHTFDWRRPRARDLPCPGSRPASRDPARALGWLMMKFAREQRHHLEMVPGGSVPGLTGISL